MWQPEPSEIFNFACNVGLGYDGKGKTALLLRQSLPTQITKKELDSFLEGSSSDDDLAKHMGLFDLYITSNYNQWPKSC